MIRIAAALFFAASVLSSAAFAQAPVQAPQNRIPAGVTSVGPDGQQKTTTVVIRPAGSCPVSMEAKQGSLAQKVETGQKPPEPQHYDPMPQPGQHIHLILAGFGKQRVTSAKVTARGLSAHSRMQELAVRTTPDMRRTMDVTFSADADNTVSADIALPAFTSVISLQLESINYADGSSWKLTNQNACLVRPDPVMLIAGR